MLNFFSERNQKLKTQNFEILKQANNHENTKNSRETHVFSSYWFDSYNKLFAPKYNMCVIIQQNILAYF